MKPPDIASSPAIVFFCRAHAMTRQHLLATATLVAALPCAGLLASACVDSAPLPHASAYGFVVAEQGFPNLDGGVDPWSLVVAGYAPPSPPGASCDVRSIGACTLSVCPPAALQPAVESTSNAGSITVAGGAQPVTIAPLDGGGYSSFFSEAPLWSGPTTLTFQATGGNVPGFTQSVVAPSPVTILEPTFLAGAGSGSTDEASVYVPAAPDASADCPAWTGPTVPRSSDFVMRWSGGTASTQLVVSFKASENLPGSCASTPSPAADMLTVACSFDAGAGVATIPAAVLGSLPAGVSSITVGVSSTATVTALGWTTEVSASTLAVDPNGAPWDLTGGGPFVLLQ